MQSVFKTLNSVQTNLLVWGEPFDCDGQDVIVCITGNPGIPDFYIEFGAELHKNTGLPLCVIGQAGHVKVPDKESNVLKNKEHLFNLEGQLDHKLDLLNNCIDKKSKIHLIGHSIGAWMIAEILQRNDEVFIKIASINLLFPTIQGMANTKNGKWLNGILRKINSLLILLFTLVYWLPKPIQLFFVSIYLKFNSLPGHYTDRVLKYLNPYVGEKVLFLAYDEMDTVSKLNLDAMDKISHLTNVIYSNRDGWAPVSYMDDLNVLQPPLCMTRVSIDHAFVLRSSEQVADMVSEFIKTRI